MASIATGRSAPSSASGPTSTTRSSATRTGSAAAWWPSDSATAASSSAGDAAHIWVPYAGYGMNAGIADAAESRLACWPRTSMAGPRAAILDAYEAERRPITEQVSQFAMDHAEREIAAARRSAGRNRGAGAGGRRGPRAETGRQLRASTCSSTAAAGLNFGYYYAASPIIAYDGESAAGLLDVGNSRPRRFPAAARRTSGLPRRARSTTCWAANTRCCASIRAVDVSPLVAAASDAARTARRCRCRLASEAAGLYTQKLVLSRPDQHVAWRGEACPDDPLALIDLVRGAGPR